MTVTESRRLDHWRKLFNDSDIFDVIENGILIAASDCPAEFHNRRVRIAEMVFSCRVSRCLGCNHVEVQVPEEEDEDGEFRRGGEGFASDGGGEKESKVNSSTDDAVTGTQMVSNCSYDEAEALTEEIEEESQIVGEVLRIKRILCNKYSESDSVLFESLRRLQLMTLSVETLKATEIGKAVNSLRKHRSNQIRHLVWTLIEEWKILVDDWVASAPVLEEATPESMNPSGFNEDFDGLPSPPLDEGVFLTTQTTSMEFSKFFEGVDDDGNPRGVVEFNKNQEIGKKFTQEKHDDSTRYEPKYLSSFDEDKVSTRMQDSINKPETLNNLARNHPPYFPSSIEDKVSVRTQDAIGNKLESCDNSMRNQPTYLPTFVEDKVSIRTQDAIGNKQESCKNSTGNQPTYFATSVEDKVSTRTQNALSKQKWLQEHKQVEVKKGLNRIGRLQGCAGDSGPSGPSGSGSRPDRHPNTSDILKSKKDLKVRRQLLFGDKPRIASQDKPKDSEDNSVRAKIEMAKRKLQERYQEAENAKKQRTIQVMELNDIPKQGLNRKPFHPKQGNLARQWANGRH